MRNIFPLVNDPDEMWWVSHLYNNKEASNGRGITCLEWVGYISCPLKSSAERLTVGLEICKGNHSISEDSTKKDFHQV
jgi:hypothetical protein